MKPKKKPYGLHKKKISFYANILKTAERKKLTITTPESI